MKCEAHDKHSVLWEDPCVEKRIPDFWKRISKVAWLVGLEATFTSLSKIKVQQTKEKWGAICVYYSSKVPCLKVKEGFVKSYRKGKQVTESHEVPKYIWKAMERQRRLNPDLAHYIYDFTPYKCRCKDNFWCKNYARTKPLQKFWDKLITKILEFYGNHSSRWCLLKGAFVVYGRCWGIQEWQKAKRTLKRPF